MEITALTVDQFFKLAEALGFKELRPEHLEKDIAEGFVCNDDGTINLFAYAAWVLSKSARADR